MTLDLLTLKQTAERLNVSVRTVRRMIADGLRVCYLRPRTPRIHPDDLERYIWACAAKGGSGVSRSRYAAGGLARRLGPPRTHAPSKPASAEIMPFPARGSRPNVA